MGRQYLANHLVSFSISEEAFDALDSYVQQYPKRWDGKKLISTSKSYVVEQAIMEYVKTHEEQQYSRPAQAGLFFTQIDYIN